MSSPVVSNLPHLLFTATREVLSLYRQENLGLDKLLAQDIVANKCDRAITLD